MKNQKNILIVALLTTVLLSFEKASAQELKGVEINGVVWATCNLGATTPTGYGNYYTWLEAKIACPKGWRLPTLDELKTLLDTTKISQEWKTEDGINGKRFTDKISGNSIFLPAAGFHLYFDGTLYKAGEIGRYWSNTIYFIGIAHGFGFSENIEGWFEAGKVKSQSARLVAKKNNS